MTEDPTNSAIRKVDSAQKYIKDKYCDTIGLATSILGQVLLGTIKGTKRKKEVIKLCLKDMKQQFADRVAESPRMEISFMNEICNRGHPNFVKFIDAVEDHKLYCICLEYVSGGDMCTYIQNLRCGIPNELSKKYAIQLTKAVYFMHCNGYCHLDLSLENVLWDKKNDVLKLCDFGLARRFPNDDISASFNAATIRPGKKGYMAPEIYAYQKFNGEKADVFSLGVLIFILLTGFPPFTTPNASDKCFQYMYYGKLEWLLKQWKLNDIIDADCRSLLSQIFCHPKKRINIKDMLQHPWLNQNISELDQEILLYKMNNRNTINNANSSAGDVQCDKKEQSPSPSSAVVNVPAVKNRPTSTASASSATARKASSASSTASAGSVSNGKKKRKSISTTIVKKKRKSKSKKQQKELISTNKDTTTTTKVGTVNKTKTNHNKTNNKNNKRRPKSKSIADINFGHLSIHESQTLLSEFAATVTNNNHSKSRSKSLCYSSHSHSSHSIHSFINGLKKDAVNTNNTMNKQTPTTQMRQRHGSKSTIREDSPLSTMSNHSNHSEQSTDSNHSNHSNRSNRSQHSINSQQDDYKSSSSHHQHPANIHITQRRQRSSEQNSANLRDGHHDQPSPVPDHQLNDTQLITKKFAMMNNAQQPHLHENDNDDNDNILDMNQNNGNFKNMDNNGNFDSDRKEGDYETYPYEERQSVISGDEERRLSITSQDAGSVHSHHSETQVWNDNNKDKSVLIDSLKNNNHPPHKSKDDNNTKTSSHSPV